MLENPTIEITGITRQDIQEIFEKTLQDFKTAKTRIIFLDASYLYNFHLSDLNYVRKLCLLTRRRPENAIEWHRLLERWYNDQTVRDPFGRTVEPIMIERTFDRVVNEGMEALALDVVGGSETSFPWRGIGKGVGITALPSDRTLADQIDRINVTQSKEGGSISRDGSTIYSIGNHNKDVETADITEVGMFSAEATTNDRMFDHSVFITPIDHQQGEDGPGSTTVIYMCSS